MTKEKDKGKDKDNDKSKGQRKRKIMTKVKDKDKNDEKSQRQRHRKQLHEHTISSNRRINKHFTIQQETRKVKYVISIFCNVYHFSSAIAKHTLLHQI